MKLGSPRRAEAYFRKIKKVLQPTRLAICYYIMMHNVTTSGFIVDELDIPENTVYRHLRQLKKWGVVNVCGVITRRGGKGVKGGPRPDMYCIDKPDPTDIARCRSRYYKECNVGIEGAKKLTQFIIEEYVTDEREVRYIDIYRKVKEDMFGYNPKPIADEIAYNLQKLEVKVWR